MYFFGLRASPTPQDLKYGLIFKIGCVVQKLDVFQIMGIHGHSSCNEDGLRTCGKTETVCALMHKREPE